jgi:MOSC domain-containing protein YiiM
VHVVSVNVGLPRTVRWKGRDVSTAIFKQPVEGRVPLRRLNLAGDRQADLSVHGGADKAVYVYPIEHDVYWRKELDAEKLPLGAFGENLTVEGLPLEDELAVGDRLRIGSVELVVTQPRVPCYKLGLGFGRSDIIERFLATGRTGYYLGVEVEGGVAAGDRVDVLARDDQRIPVGEVIRVYARDRSDLETIERLVALAALPEAWRSHFAKRLESRGITPAARTRSSRRGRAARSAHGSRREAS